MLNFSQVQFICEKLSKGQSVSQISKFMNISPDSVYKIRAILKSRRFLTTSGKTNIQRTYWLSSDPIPEIAKEIYNYAYL